MAGNGVALGVTDNRPCCCSIDEAAEGGCARSMEMLADDGRSVEGKQLHYRQFEKVAGYGLGHHQRELADSFLGIEGREPDPGSRKGSCLLYAPYLMMYTEGDCLHQMAISMVKHHGRVPCRDHPGHQTSLVRTFLDCLPKHEKKSALLVVYPTF